MSALALLSGLVLEDGRRWGEVATSWQRADAAAILDPTGPVLHFQTRPRGGSKTTDLAGAVLALLIEEAPPSSRSYAVAVDADQAGLLHDALRGFVERNGLGGVVQVDARRVMVRTSGATLEVLAADGASAYGLRPWLLVIDELAAWPATPNHRRLWQALVSAQPKTGGRLVCLTSAGDPGHWSFRVLEHARVSAAWRVSEVEGPLPWRSEADLVEQRALLPASVFAQLHLNRWMQGEDRLTTVDDVRRCIGHVGALPPVDGVRYVVSLDVGLVNDRTVVVVAHVERLDEGSALVVVDRIDVWQGSRSSPVDLVNVEAHIAEASKLYHRAAVVVDPFQAVHLAQGLRRRGVSVTEFAFSVSSTGRLGVLLYRLLRDGLLDLPDDAELVDELANVRLRQSAPGTYRLDHDSGRHDDRAVGIALAAHWLLERTTRRRARFTIEDEGAVMTGWGRP